MLRRLLARLFGPDGSRASPDGPAVAVFRTEVASAVEARDARALDALAARQAELGLAGQDVETELELIEGTRELLRFAAAVDAAGALPRVETQHRVVGAEACHFLAPAMCDEGEGDSPPGKLFLTERRLVYAGRGTLSIGWEQVAGVRREGLSIVCDRSGGPTLTVRCNSFADALRAAFVAQRLIDRRGLRL